MSFNRIITALKGGTGSGNFGHEGRPGHIGGSTSGSGGGGLDTGLYNQRKAAMASYYKSEAGKVKYNLEQGNTSVGAQLTKWNGEMEKLSRQVANPTTKGNAEDAKAAMDLIQEHVVPAIHSAKITGLPKDVMPKISDRERRQILSSITGKRR